MGLLSRLLGFWPYIYINYVRLFKLTVLYQPTYNPRNLFLISSKQECRSCENRILAIKNNIDFSRVNSYLDIGSQLGYFVFRLSDLGKFVISQGIEMDNIACNYACAILILNKKQNVSFVNAKVDLSFVKKMPPYDLISFLSVFHHIVYFEGFEVADKIMQELYRKTNYYFVFETGQFNEKGLYWSESLSFMGTDPEGWLKNYLKNIGYRDVKVVGRFATHLEKIDRAFFVCSK